MPLNTGVLRECKVLIGVAGWTIFAQMVGRRQTTGHVLPLATAVNDAKYCFLRQSDPHPHGNGLTLLCAGRERCLPGYHVSRTDFKCTSVELVVGGRGRLRIGGESRELLPGAVFTYGTDTPHDIWSDSAEPMTKYFAAYNLVDKSLDSRLGVPGAVGWSQDSSSIQTLFESLIREGRRDSKAREEITSRYLELILLKAVESMSGGEDRITGGGQQIYERALACIEAQFAELSTLSQISDMVGVGANYVCRLFKRFGEETPIQCLTRHKMNRAAELLLSSRDDAIYQVAKAVGYEDPYYFTRVFTKRFGCSPKQFRERTI